MTEKNSVVEFDKQTVYPVEQGLELTRQLSKTKFDASVEVHIRLGIDPKKGDQEVKTKRAHSTAASTIRAI